MLAISAGRDPPSHGVRRAGPARQQHRGPADTTASRPQRVEHDYDRGGALCHLAAWDVHRGRLIGRCEQQTGIVPFGRLVGQVMTAEPCARARRVFWIVDNSSSHRGQPSIDRLQGQWPNLVLVHLPFYASWLSQIEIARVADHEPRLRLAA